MNTLHCQEQNLDFHALWVGKPLTLIEILCVNSFINNGHRFHLWLYDAIDTQLPDKVIVEDANEIIPKEEVFCYKNSNQFGHGKGSYAGFSDVFRYKLLYMKGGWWTDMDVICLKPFCFTDTYVFRSHHDYPAIGNIMKCPQGCDLMLDCYTEAKSRVNEDNTDWDLPIKILNKNIEKHHLLPYIKHFSNPDDWNYVKKLVISNVKIPDNWVAVHLLNEELRKNRIYKDAFSCYSFIGRQIKKNIRQPLCTNFAHVLKNYYHASLPSNLMDISSNNQKIKFVFLHFYWKLTRTLKKSKTK